MTVASQTSRKTFTGDDVTVAFATTPIVFFAETDLLVYLITTATGAAELQTLTTDYTVAGGDGAVGTVTMLTAPASTQTLLIRRSLPITQASDFVQNDASDAEVLEEGLDRLTMIAQQLAAGEVSGGYGLRIPSLETPTDALTTLPFDRASTVLGFNASKELTTYDASSAVTESSNVTFLQSGTGARAQTMQEKCRQVFHVKDFKNTDGTDYAGNGTQDDTSSINRAITAAGSGTLYWSGTPKITSGITIEQGKHIFEGRLGINSTFRPGSYIIKDAALNGTALTVNASAWLQGGGVVAEEGNGGVNIRVISNSARWDNGYSENAGTHGWWVDGTVNTNHATLIQCRSYGNTTHGFYIAGDDANALSLLSCFSQSNGGDGFFSEKVGSGANPAWNSFIGCGADQNTGYGIRLKGGTDNAIVGGDYEANTTGDIFIESNEKFCTLAYQNLGSVITDSGYRTRRLDLYMKKHATYAAAIRGESGAINTATAVSINGTAATVTSVAHGYSNGDMVYHVNFANDNLNGAFVISNVTANTYDITFRTDASPTPPETATGLVVSIQKCGVYTKAIGNYTLEDGWCEFMFRVTTSAVTNISGNVQIILPFAAQSITDQYASVNIGYFEGITCVNSLKLLVEQNGSRTHPFYEDVGGTPGTPSQLQATALAAATTIIAQGRYKV